jgi:hypothetical protein
VEALIGTCLSELRQKSFTELLQLEDYQGEKVKKNGKTFTVAIWKDVMNEHKLRIVVQVYRYWFLGIGRMDAKGFIIDDTGKVEDLSKEAIYEFI